MSNWTPRQRAILAELERRRLAQTRRPTIADKSSELAERSLYHFVKQAWPVIEPATDYLDNWHIPYVCEILEEVTAGNIRRLVLNWPPRMMKSIIVSVCWPVWEWIGNPGLNYIFDSYAEALMVDHSIARRRIIESEWFQRRWGHRVRLLDGENRQDDYRNNALGRMVANFTSTGRGANRVISDDPHRPDQAESDAVRRSQVAKLSKNLYSRMNNPKVDVFVIVAQRVHEEDASAWGIGQGFTHIKLPMEAPQRTIFTFPKSGRVHVREKGDLLWEQRMGLPEIAATKRALGSYAYAGQYGQEPAPAEGGLIKRHWFKWYKTGQQTPEKFDEIIQSWDMAFKDLKTSDFVSCGVWGRLGARKYLLDGFCERLSFTDTCAQMRLMSEKWPGAILKLVEDAANGPAIASQLSDEIEGIVLVPPSKLGSKTARVFASQPTIEAGNVYLPLIWDAALGAWVEPLFVQDLLTQATLFPNGSNDDAVDQMTLALLRFLGVGEETGATAVVPALRIAHSPRRDRDDYEDDEE